MTRINVKYVKLQSNFNECNAIFLNSQWLPTFLWIVHGQEVELICNIAFLGA